MQYTFSEPLVWNMAIPSEPTCEPLLLQVNLSSVKPKDETPFAVVPLTSLNATLLHVHPAVEHPSETATSMTTELQKLLSWAMPDTSDPVPGITAPRRLPFVTLGS